MYESYTYRPDGSLLTKTDKNGVTTSYTYDIHGRVLKETVGNLSTAYTYDSNSNILTITDAEGTTSYTYDVTNRTVSKETPVFGTTTYAYDITQGLPIGYTGESTETDGYTVVKVYDKTGKLVEVQDGADVTSYEYYPNGSLKRTTLPNGVTSEYVYHENNKLKTLETRNGVQTIEAYQYAYDGAGNMTAKLDAKGITEYTYTGLSQLLTVLEPSGRHTEYSYDGAGNRLSEVVSEDDSEITTTYEINSQNRLVCSVEESDEESETTDYTYDDAGNLTQKTASAETAVYDYNSKNQMIMADAEGSVVTNTFNFAGYRSSKTVDGVTSDYLYEYDRIIKEVDSNSNTTYNVYGINLISKEENGSKAYYIYNGHGDVTGLVDPDGVVIVSYYYDAFGNILEATGSAKNNFAYSGYFYDSEVGLYNLNARFYDAKIARFMQEDTYLGNGADPLSLNLYAYCKNNPIKYYDPTGHYVSATDKANLTSTQIAQLEQLTIDWYNADAEGKKDINNAANAIRLSAGYSGGTNGNSITVSSGKTVKTVTVNDTTTVSNKGTINTVNILNGATSTINNSGKIDTVNVYKGATSAIDNSGKIGTINNSGNVYIMKNTGKIDTINNRGTIGIGIVNTGSIGDIKNSGIITSIDNGGIQTSTSGTTLREIAEKYGGVAYWGSDGQYHVSFGSIGQEVYGANSIAFIGNYGNWYVDESAFVKEWGIVTSERNNSNKFGVDIVVTQFKNPYADSVLEAIATRYVNRMTVNGNEIFADPTPDKWLRPITFSADIRETLNEAGYISVRKVTFNEAEFYNGSTQSDVASALVDTPNAIAQGAGIVLSIFTADRGLTTSDLCISLQGSSTYYFLDGESYTLKYHDLFGSYYSALY